jgi:aspartyl protease family protein
MEKRTKSVHIIATAALILISATASAAPDIRVHGLMPNQAIATIDGKQRVLKVGQTSTDGLTLVEADSEHAVFEWHGERIERTLSREITSKYSERTDKEVRIVRGTNNHFFTEGQINGQPVRFMVDTGAFAVALTPAEADRIGLNWRQGERFMANTAGGGTPGYRVQLDSVSVGDITLNNVTGAVIVADSSDNIILLGMSFLERTEMREENNTLVLRKKY